MRLYIVLTLFLSLTNTATACDSSSSTVGEASFLEQIHHLIDHVDLRDYYIVYVQWAGSLENLRAGLRRAQPQEPSQMKVPVFASAQDALGNEETKFVLGIDLSYNSPTYGHITEVYDQNGEEVEGAVSFIYPATEKCVITDF